MATPSAWHHSPTHTSQLPGPAGYEVACSGQGIPGSLQPVRPGGVASFGSINDVQRHQHSPWLWKELLLPTLHLPTMCVLQEIPVPSLVPLKAWLCVVSRTCVFPRAGLGCRALAASQLPAPPPSQRHEADAACAFVYIAASHRVGGRPVDWVGLSEGGFKVSSGVLGNVVPDIGSRKGHGYSF